MDFNLSDIEIKLRDKISNEISLREEGVNRFRIFNPYEFDDGDHFSIFLKKENGRLPFSEVVKGSSSKLLCDTKMIMSSSQALPCPC